MNYSSIPAEMQAMSNWVCSKKSNKIPFRAWDNLPASAADPGTWCSFLAAHGAVAAGLFDYLGFMFDGSGIIGIDIDQGYDEEGLPSMLAADIIGACKSYTERSRSGRGFHILLKGDLPFKGKNNQQGLEIYKTGRYFILTGDIVLYSELRANQAAIDYVVDKYFRAQDRQTDAPDSVIYQPTWTAPTDAGHIYLQANYPDIVSGSRNISLASWAGALHNMGCSKDLILAELKNVNARACRPPVSDYELKQITNSICRYKR